MTTAAAIPQTSLFPLNISVPSTDATLASKAMLCSLSISSWTGYRYDEHASEEIAEIHGADKDSGRYNKRLVPRKELIELTKVIGQARRDHEFNTLPWADNGGRILPASVYMEHTELMRTHGASFWATYNRLAARFEDLVGQQNRLGTLFNVEDYPGMRLEHGVLRFAFPEELKAKFSFETKILPLPNANDFRVALGEQDRERVKRQITETIQASLRVGTRDLWQRLYEVVSHMATRMAEYNQATQENKPKLYSSMVTNILKIVDVLPKLNIAEDRDLDRMADDIRHVLLVDTKELRKSPELSNDTARAAADIAQRMAAYMGMPVPQELS
jgi:hypothetical protein